MKREIRNAYTALILLITILSVGIAGYMLIEKLSFNEAFYMTIITVATVGFREVGHQLTVPGMYFTSFLIIVSFGIFAFAVTTFIRYVVDGTFRHLYKSRRVRRRIQRIKDHVIVCGFGRNGRQVVQELLEHDVPLVVIERNEEVMEKVLDNPDLLYIHGDATQDEVLASCEINRARALITTLPVDADNLFVVLTARELNPSMTIISRASHENSDLKLKRAGANNVIMPDRIGGQRMAKLVAQPDVLEFLEFLMLQSSENVALEEISCNKLAPYFDGKSIRELDIRNESGANIIGLKRSDKTFIINPLPEVVLTSHDMLFVLGTKRQIDRLRNILYSGTTV